MPVATTSKNNSKSETSKVDPVFILLGFLILTSCYSPYNYVSASVSSGGQVILDVKVTDASGGQVRTTSATKLPLQSWFCFELRVDWGDASHGHAQVFFDDKPIDYVRYDGATQDSPVLDTSVWGTTFNSAPADSYSVWADELVLASQPIGCAR